jgi:hypothetical protein
VFVENVVAGVTSIDPLVTPVVVLERGTGSPQVRRLGAVPSCVLARLTGPTFETSKSFLLPGAIDRLGRLASLYAANAPSELLIVGHADTAGGRALNDALSLERAENMAAFLQDQVEIWLKMYDEPLPISRRWSAHEDALMLRALPDVEQKPAAESLVRWFQRTRDVSVDGIAGPITRRQLITEYMALDAARLDDKELAIRITTHGCGENFPLDASGQALDSAPPDGKSDGGDRRVELFFFDVEFGILPAPPGKNSGAGSSAYPAWREGVREVVEMAASSTAQADCDLDLELGLSDGTVLSSQRCDVHVNGKVHALKTDAQGRLLLDALAPDDYLVQVGSFRLFVTAVRRGQGTRRLCLTSAAA